MILKMFLSYVLSKQNVNVSKLQCFLIGNLHRGSKVVQGLKEKYSSLGLIKLEASYMWYHYSYNDMVRELGMGFSPYLLHFSRIYLKASIFWHI